MPDNKTFSPTRSVHIGDFQFDYMTAFGRNLGWVTQAEQQILRAKKVAIAGLGGVGGSHALTFARLGIGHFHLADFDRFDLANMNRQAGAFISTIKARKCAVIASMVTDINPEAQITDFPDGIGEDTIDTFLDGADLFVDGLDFFVLDIRRKVFARAYELGIPAITAAPLGLGVAWLLFMPGKMSFEQYFQFGNLPSKRQYVNFMIGLAPKALHRSALVDPSRVNFSKKSGPSTNMACQMASAIVGSEAIKILLKRGAIKAAPHYHQFDPYKGRFTSGHTFGGNAHPLRRIKCSLAARWIDKIAPKTPPIVDSADEDAPLLKTLLDLARWAPSGDNEQPWRFEILGEDKLLIHLIHQPGRNVYEYADGRPIWLAAGGLIETLDIAASQHGLSCHYDITTPEDGSTPIILVTLIQEPRLADPLVHFIKTRSVNRWPYRRESLDHKEKALLEQAAGPEVMVEWFESAAERWAVTRLNMMATRLRLGIMECHDIHKSAVTFNDPQAPFGLPASAIGLDPLTIRIMRWANAEWWRTKLLNRYLGGSIAASLQLDIIPGMKTGAHFIIRWRDDKADRPLEDWVRAGRRMQRFWLTAESVGLSLQPGFAPVIFAHAAAQQRIWRERRTAEKAQHIGERLESLFGCSADAIVFPGRIGRAQALPQSRSTRLPLDKLIIEKT